MRAHSATSSTIRHVGGRLVEGLLIAATIALVGFFAAPAIGATPLFSGAADAAPKVRATIAASPAVVPMGQAVVVSGAGLDPARQTWIRTQTVSAVGWTSVGVAVDGSYSATLSFPVAGTARLDVYQIVNNRQVLAASASVVVY